MHLWGYKYTGWTEKGQDYLKIAHMCHRCNLTIETSEDLREARKEICNG